MWKSQTSYPLLAERSYQPCVLLHVTTVSSITPSRTEQVDKWELTGDVVTIIQVNLTPLKGDASLIVRARNAEMKGRLRRT
jgi:hypothetical protein